MFFQRFSHAGPQLRALTLNEKISIKGRLSRYDIYPQLLARLTMPDALFLFWRCAGVPESYHSTSARWRKRMPRTGNGEHLAASRLHQDTPSARLEVTKAVRSGWRRLFADDGFGNPVRVRHITPVWHFFFSAIA